MSDEIAIAKSESALHTGTMFVGSQVHQVLSPVMLQTYADPYKKKELLPSGVKTSIQEISDSNLGKSMSYEDTIEKSESSLHMGTMFVGKKIHKILSPLMLLTYADPYEKKVLYPSGLKVSVHDVWNTYCNDNEEEGTMKNGTEILRV